MNTPKKVESKKVYYNRSSLSGSNITLYKNLSILKLITNIKNDNYIRSSIIKLMHNYTHCIFSQFRLCCTFQIIQ